ncbi:hypothetical protein BDP27DRAFT_559997 [Rhodocollybia butyracea]|uniref:Uncharacterized protein n=1 Tax=Rhodocollybia butyracea TaxID=206335 RepID=A0A9P5U9E2_9AGAR|nr:hypothetical protein BDP27DRAFT_559997 [Rhodocollybia butyracea]
MFQPIIPSEPVTSEALLPFQSAYSCDYLGHNVHGGNGAQSGYNGHGNGGWAPYLTMEAANLVMGRNTER